LREQSQQGDRGQKNPLSPVFFLGLFFQLKYLVDSIYVSEMINLQTGEQS